MKRWWWSPTWLSRGWSWKQPEGRGRAPQEATVGRVHVPEPISPSGDLLGRRPKPQHTPLHKSPTAADDDVGLRRYRPSTKGGHSGVLAGGQQLASHRSEYSLAPSESPRGQKKRLKQGANYWSGDWQLPTLRRSWAKTEAPEECPKNVCCRWPHQPQHWWDVSPQSKQFGIMVTLRIGGQVWRGSLFSRWRHRASQWWYLLVELCSFPSVSVVLWGGVPV